MSALYTCDICGTTGAGRRLHAGAWRWSHPQGWYEHTAADTVYDVCSIKCLQASIEAYGTADDQIHPFPPASIRVPEGKI